VSEGDGAFEATVTQVLALAPTRQSTTSPANASA